MFKKFTLVVVILFFSLSTLKAQKNNPFKDFKDGIVITHTSDTLVGKINNKSFYKNSKVCEFLNSKGEIIKYTPNDIAAFQFYNGKYYITTKIDSSNVFLEYLIKGKLNVYYLQNKKRKDIYFASSDSIAIHQLKHNNSTVKNDGTVRLKNQKLFINQLNYFTRDYPELSTSINKINEPNHKDLIKIAKQYHEYTCKDGSVCLVYEKTEKRNILIGFMVTGNHLIDPNYEIDLKEYYTAFSAHVYFQQFRRSERFFVGLGLNVAEQRTIESESNRAKIIESNVQIPLSLNYIHLKNGITPTFMYSFDLNTFLLLQNIQAGLRYQKNELSFFTTVGVAKGGRLLNFYASQINFGFMYKLRRN